MDNEIYCVHCMKKISDHAINCPFCGKSISEYEAEAHHLVPYTILNGKYLIGRVLGEGGFGITYIAQDLNLEMRVAVKEYFPYGCVNRNHSYSPSVTVNGSVSSEEFEAGKKKLMQEARTLAKFSDLRGIVGVHDFFLYNNTAYVVMDYLEGITLKEYLKAENTMPFEKILSLLTPIMNDLTAVHESGLIHRDISPDNIMILKDGSARLLDFGAARQTEGNDTKSLSIILKPGYTPEEQYRARGEQGPWTDVYSLSATIYRAVTGRIPDEALQRMVDDELKKPSELHVRMKPAQERALMKGMAIYRKDRYQNVGQLMKGLQFGETNTVVLKAMKDTEAKNKSRALPRGKLLISAGAALCIILTGALAITGARKSRIRDENSLPSLSAEPGVEELYAQGTSSEMQAESDAESGDYKQMETLTTDVTMDALDSFAIQIDGETYQFPMTYDELTRRGWELSKAAYAEDVIESGYLEEYDMYLNGNEIRFIFWNSDNQHHTLKECYSIGFLMEEKFMENHDVLLPNGLHRETVTRSDLVNAYGDPADVNERTEATWLSYEWGHNKFWRFGFDTNSGKLIFVLLENAAAPDDFAVSTISILAMEEELRYKAPTKLGDDVISDIVKCDGNLYRLPCPLNAMLDNDWQMSLETEVKYLNAGGELFLKLTRNGKTNAVLLKNLDDEAHWLENCFVTKLSSSYGCELVLPGGIAAGMKESELLEILNKSGHEYKWDSSGWYNVSREEDISSEYGAHIRIENGTVIEIMYNNIKFED